MAHGDFSIYTVTVFGNGMVHWYGKDHVKHLGPAFWNVLVESIQLLERRLLMTPFHSYRDEYREYHTTDMAWDVLEIEFTNGTCKRIDQYQANDSAPVELNLLGQAVEKIVGRWPCVGEFGGVAVHTGEPGISLAGSRGFLQVIYPGRIMKRTVENKNGKPA